MKLKLSVFGAILIGSYLCMDEAVLARIRPRLLKQGTVGKLNLYFMTVHDELYGRSERLFCRVDALVDSLHMDMITGTFYRPSGKCTTSYKLAADPDTKRDATPDDTRAYVARAKTLDPKPSNSRCGRRGQAYTDAMFDDEVFA